MNHRKYSIIFLFLLLASLLSAQDRGFVPKKPDGSQERRIALVIGNNTYQKPGMSLKNAGNDAQDMGKVLQEIGFEVHSFQNLDYRNLSYNIDQFVSKLKSYDVAMVYYAGHGLSYQNENFLVPIDADIQSESQIAYHCYSLNKLIANVESSKIKNTIVILDACRNNLSLPQSFRSLDQQGLVAPINPQGTYIVFATQEGKKAMDNIESGRNGLFTSALLKHIKTPNLTLKQIVDNTKQEVLSKSKGAQLPNAYDQILGDFYFLKSIKGQEKPSAELLDSDGDGILDKVDKCPNDYGSVENGGCPEKINSTPNSNSASAEISRAIKLYNNLEYGESYNILNQFKDNENMSQEAFFILGELSFRFIKPNNITQAKIFYRIAAEKGHSHAQYRLGHIYRGGYRTEDLDCIESVKWMEKAILQNNTDAIYQMAFDYSIEGFGCVSEKDIKKAFELYEKGAKLGSTSCMVELGEWYKENGGGKRKSQNLALAWYQKACDNGDSDGCNKVKELSK